MDFPLMVIYVKFGRMGELQEVVQSDYTGAIICREHAELLLLQWACLRDHQNAQADGKESPGCETPSSPPPKLQTYRYLYKRLVPARLRYI